MIKYRPHKGSLADAMAEYREFDSIAKMLKHIESQLNGYVSTSDIVIGEAHGKDERVGWNSWRYVCTVRFGDERYLIPQCIGTCDLGEED